MKNIINYNKWLILVIVCMGLFMILLDTSVVNLAIPQIMNSFNVGLDQIEWINNGYILAFAMLLILTGRLGDQYGPKILFLIGLVVFTAGSMLTGTSANIHSMIFFRVLQGIGGACMLPVTLSIISLVFPPKERGTAMGIWGAISGLSIVLGPIIGGYLTTLGLGESINNFLHVSEFWRYVFYINVPVGIITFLLAIKYIPNLKNNVKYAFDGFGTIVLGLSIFILTYALIEGQTYGWFKANEAFSIFNHTFNFGGVSVVPFLFLIGLFLMILFIVHENKYAKDPLVDIKLFKDRNFYLGNISALIFNLVMMGTFFILPLFLQQIIGFSPVEAGKNILPFAISIILTAPIAGKLADKIGGKFIIISGLVIMSAGVYMLGNLSGDVTAKQLFLPYIIVGLGIGATVSPLTNITLINISENEAGSASGVYSTTRQIGSIMGIAIMGASLQFASLNFLVNKLQDEAGFSKQYSTEIVKIASQNTTNADWQNFMNEYQTQITAFLDSNNIDISSSEEKANLKNNLIASKKQSFVFGMDKTFHLASLATIITALICFGLKKEDPSQKNKKQTVTAA